MPDEPIAFVHIALLRDMAATLGMYAEFLCYLARGTPTAAALLSPC